MNVKWIPIEKIRPLISYETFLFTLVLIAIAYLFYHLFLKRISERRHGQLRHRFFLTLIFWAVSAGLAAIYWMIWMEFDESLWLQKATSYLGLFTLFLGALTLIRIAQIYVYLYLFFSNISTGVPRLIGNLFTLLFSTFLFGWIVSYVFDINIAAFAATSAVFSLVLGLALQDTLGNFFSGLALQLERPFQISDWVEIQDGAQKWTGQIQEINWRATYLLTFAHELIVVPNRTVAQSKIMILSNSLRPIRLSQVFRFGFGTSIEVAKRALLEGVQGFPEVMNNPGPVTLVTDTHESWITIKVYYSLYDYGTRYISGDAILSNILTSIHNHGLKLAHPALIVHSEVNR